MAPGTTNNGQCPELDLFAYAAGDKPTPRPSATIINFENARRARLLVRTLRASLARKYGLGPRDGGHAA